MLKREAGWNLALSRRCDGEKYKNPLEIFGK
jgi:hypothetical protein